MIYVMHSNKLRVLQNTLNDFRPQRSKKYIIVSTPTAFLDTVFDKSVLDTVYTSTLSNTAPRYESHIRLDVICLPLHNFLSSPSSPVVHIFLQDKLLQFVSEDPTAIIKFFDHFIETDTSASFGKILYLFFNSQLNDDLDELEKIEDRLSIMEDEILSNEHLNVNYSQKAIAVSRIVRLTKQYYEQFSNIIESLSWNENNFFDDATLKYFKILGSKLDRLLENTARLLTFASEVREMYQTEVDMRANKIMQLFTVITVIFAPLTLLVGWYGMNLMMPEFHFRYAYPVIIAASLIFSISIIWYFKKRKWF
ncbi:MAG: hypothetical protein GX245_02125 [Eubacteriaceae bacterium]|nr:hypothetical protein [Eubacteriaceae bacterium]